jgi:hypothetical protein
LPLAEMCLAEEAGDEVVTRHVQKKHKHGRNPVENLWHYQRAASGPVPMRMTRRSRRQR